MNRRKAIILIMIFIFMLITLCGCMKKNDEYPSEYVKGDCEVYIVVDYESNILLAKEAIDIYVDNKKFYTVENGSVNANVYYLTEGKHLVKVRVGKGHKKETEIEVENTGDYFIFHLKNHMNKMDFGLTKKGNIIDDDIDVSMLLDND